MTLIVETGSGLINADSYVSLADANTYTGATFFSGKWSTQTDTDKEKLLRTATAYLDSFYDYKGVKVFPSASLRWPRSQVLDRDGNEVSSLSVPVAVKNAVIEMAIYLVENNLLQESESKGIQSVKVDAVEIAFERSEKNWKIPNTVSHLLRGYGTIVTNPKVGKLIDS